MKRIASKCSNEKKLDNKHILKTQKYWRGKRTQGWKKTKNKLINKKKRINTRILKRFHETTNKGMETIYDI